MDLLDEVRWLPGAPRLCSLAREEQPQKNELCGAFVGLVALRANGFRVRDQDEVAVAAGSVLHDGDLPSWPAGEVGRADFRLRLPQTAHLAEAGTSAAGVATAVHELSDGRLTAVPARGDWTPRALDRLLDGAFQLREVALIGNVVTGEFGAQDTPQRPLRDYLDLGVPPLWPSRWKVGHFVLLGGVLAGASGTLVSIVDSYPSLGDRGVHLQPIERVSAALRREGMPPGGVLAVVPTELAADAVRVAEAAGLRAEPWDG